MAVSTQTDGWLTLEDSRTGDLVRVDGFVGEVGNPRCGWSGLFLRQGEILQCIDYGRNGVTVARTDGSRTVIPAECAGSVGVVRVPDHLTLPGDGADPALLGEA